MVFPLYVEGQTFKKIGVQDGLPSSIIYDIEADKNGIVWIATFGSGLCRYDGKTFKVLNEDNGLTSDLVRCLSINDKNDKLYVGAQGALNIITKDSLYNKNRLLNDSLNPNVLFLSVNQNTVQTCSNFGLITIVNDKVVRTLKKFTNVSGYYKAVNGNEYVATRTGLFIIKPNQEIIDYNKAYNKDITLITDLKFFNEELVMSTTKGIYKIDKQNNITHITKNEGLPQENIRCMVVDKNNVLWLGTVNGLVSTKDVITFNKYDNKNGIDETEIKCMTVDHNNTLWIGTTYNGMFKLISNDIVKYELPQSPVSVAMNTKKEIYVLTNKSILYKLNTDSNKFIKEYVVKSASDAIVKHLSIDKFNNFYITINNKGFLKIDTKGNETLLTKTIKENDNIPLYSFAYKENVWLAFKRIVIKYDPIKNIMDTLQRRLKENYFQDIVNDNQGNIWVTTGMGLIKYNDKKILQFVNNGTHNDFPSSVTNYVHPDKYNHIWAITDKGLLCVENSNIYTNYRKDGFLSNELFELQIMDTLLFTGCNKGLIQLNIKSSKNLKNKYILINERFGLSQTDLTNKPIFSDSANIWIGGVNAVYKYKPTNYEATIAKSKLFINDVIKDSLSLVYRKSKNYLQSFLDTSSTIELNFRENNFKISYVSINHQRLQDEIFTYRLVGLSNSWSMPTNDTKAIFTNLSPGSYVFEVMVVNDFNSTVSLRIYISPPFYKTTWFIVLMILLGLIIVYSLFQARLKSIKNKNIVLEKKVEERTLQLKNKTQLLTQSNDELSKKNKLIFESMEYAKKIQESILPSQSYLNKQFKDVASAFVYLPKDIVSGDFFYTNKQESLNYFAVVDCTGHGVPGALLSFSINSILHGIIENLKEFNPPSTIIKDLLKKFTEIYIKDQDVKESFAISLVIYNSNEKQVYISTISQSVLMSNGNELLEIKNQSSFLQHSNESITDVIYSAKPGTRLFLYSDGYYDQKNAITKRRMYKNVMVKTIEESLSLPLNKQLNELNNFFIAFKGDHEQIDDVTVFAIEIT